jgi:hypothetical protein
MLSWVPQAQVTEAGLGGGWRSAFVSSLVCVPTERLVALTVTRPDLGIGDTVRCYA